MMLQEKRGERDREGAANQSCKSGLKDKIGERKERESRGGGGSVRQVSK